MALPLANDRIEKAVAIVLSGATLHADGYAVGASQSRPPMSYSVNGTCGCPDVCYAGLLAKAHEAGLVKLDAHIEFYSDALVLANATATCSNGRVFTEWADATLENVGVQVRPHRVHMVLTRAKARALRDALNIGMGAVEEVSE